MLPARILTTALSSAIDPVAASRWLAREPQQSPWLHEEVARRMAERLDIIRLPVRQWAHWAPAHGGLQGQARVAAHYPRARCLGVAAPAEPAPGQAAPAARKWWARLRPGKQALVAAPADASVQLVWANMLAHQVAEPAALLAGWHRALAVGGFVMFSCLGPDTLKELRALYDGLGWLPPAQDFIDMHDWGDALLSAGFAEPVMDMETIVLTFDTPERLLAELRGLGRNLRPQRFAGLRTPAWRQRLLAAMNSDMRQPPGAGPLRLSFEVIYGHAIKPGLRPAVAGEAAISLADMRASLKKSLGNAPPV